jgi:hypothetical protein
MRSISKKKRFQLPVATNNKLTVFSKIPVCPGNIKARPAAQCCGAGGAATFWWSRSRTKMDRLRNTAAAQRWLECNLNLNIIRTHIGPRFFRLEYRRIKYSKLKGTLSRDKTLKKC